MSNNSDSFVGKGTTIIKQAVDKDNNNELEAALSLYQQGIQYLMTSLKYEKNDKVNSAVKEKIEKYLKRAEDIKESLATPKQPAKKKKTKKQKHTPAKKMMMIILTMVTLTMATITMMTMTIKNKKILIKKNCKEQYHKLL